MYHGTPPRVARDLERQLRFVARWCDVVPLGELAKSPKGNGRKRVALTFDDGLRTNVSVAYPILRKLGLHGTFFVCPGLIERGEWLWNHEARQRLLALNGKTPEEVEAFVEWMKTLNLAARNSVEAQLRAATPRFKPTPAQREEFDLASWDELRSLDPKVVSIGSHTMTHPILTSLAPSETEAELRDSRQAIEKQTGRAADLFCYPNGDFGDDTLQSVRKHYRAAVTVSAKPLKEWDAHRLPRIGAPGPGMRGMLRLAKQLLV